MADTSEQLKAIWTVLSPLVEKQIAQKGGFSPMGATLRTGQPVEVVLPATTGNADELLRAHLRTLAATGLYEAIGMASKVEANVAESKTSVFGILYQFDSADGVSQATFLPYTIDAVGNIAYGELHGQEGDHALFPNSRKPS